jgi:hypothetical protein
MHEPTRILWANLTSFLLGGAFIPKYTRSWYERHLYPALAEHQRVFLVPGAGRGATQALLGILCSSVFICARVLYLRFGISWMVYDKRRLNGATRPRPGVYSDKTLPRNVSARIVPDAPARFGPPRNRSRGPRDIYGCESLWEISLGSRVAFLGAGPSRGRRCSTRSPASGVAGGESFIKCQYSSERAQ